MLDYLFRHDENYNDEKFLKKNEVLVGRRSEGNGRRKRLQIQEEMLISRESKYVW